ncbi:MAG: hypothetical protein KIT22_07625, partial [Verrucomicrobiae bacterium]|nr:hypothetical protein [Verrucomicrobiae bacterium]
MKRTSLFREFRHRAATGLALLAATWALSAGAARAQSTLLHTEPRTGGGDYGIEGLELYNRGYYWWKTAHGSGEFGASSRLRIVYTVPSVVNGFSQLVRYTQNEGDPAIQGAAFDGGWVYFSGWVGSGAGVPGLYRKPANAGPAEGIQLLAPSGAEQLSTLAGVTVHNGFVYFFPQYNNRYAGVVRVPVDALGNAGAPELKAEGVLGDNSAAKKILFYRRKGPFVDSTLLTWGLVLKQSGALIKFGPLEQQGPVPFTLLTTGVGDVLVRTEATGLFSTLQDRIYGTTSALYPISTPGRLFAVNPDTGATTDIYTAPRNPQILGIEALAADANFIFLSLTSKISGQPGQILRNYLPVEPSIRNPALDTGGQFVTMEEGGASIMRSDGRWLYFTREHEVRRVSTTVPPIALDIGVFGLEVVQVSQNLANTVPLVAGKRAIARGYVWLTANSRAATRPTRSPEASLEVYHEGQLLWTLPPYRYPKVQLETGDLATLLASHRGDPAKNFLFEVPGNLIRPGTMRFQLKVNERHSIVETGVPNPWNNNAVFIPSMSAEARVRPTLIAVAVANRGAPNYTPNYSQGTDPFWSIVARAESLLPVSGFDIRPSPFVLTPTDAPSHITWNLSATNDESNAALTALAAANMTSFGADDHRLGMVHPSIPKYTVGTNVNQSQFNGLGNVSGNNLLVRMEPTDLTGFAWNTPYGGRTLAHELGHNYGRQHVRQDTNNCGTGVPDNPLLTYPYDNTCRIGPTPNTLNSA